MLEPFIDSLGSRLIRIAQDPNLSGGDIYDIDFLCFLSDGRRAN